MSDKLPAELIAVDVTIDNLFTIMGINKTIN